LVAGPYQDAASCTTTTNNNNKFIDAKKISLSKKIKTFVYDSKYNLEKKIYQPQWNLKLSN